MIPYALAEQAYAACDAATEDGERPKVNLVAAILAAVPDLTSAQALQLSREYREDMGLA